KLTTLCGSRPRWTPRRRRHSLQRDQGVVIVVPDGGFCLVLHPLYLREELGVLFVNPFVDVVVLRQRPLRNVTVQVCQLSVNDSCSPLELCHSRLARIYRHRQRNNLVLLEARRNRKVLMQENS